MNQLLTLLLAVALVGSGCSKPGGPQDAPVGSTSSPTTAPATGSPTQDPLAPTSSTPGPTLTGTQTVTGALAHGLKPTDTPGRSTERLEELVVDDGEAVGGYDRDLFPHWDPASFT